MMDVNAVVEDVIAVATTASDEDNLLNNPGVVVMEVKDNHLPKNKQTEVPKYSWTTDATEGLIFDEGVV